MGKGCVQECPGKHSMRSEVRGHIHKYIHKHSSLMYTKRERRRFLTLSKMFFVCCRICFSKSNEGRCKFTHVIP